MYIYVQVGTKAVACDRTLPRLSLLQEYQNFLWFPSPLLRKMD